jgi:lysophospholipase L1-like esterase
MRVPRLFTIGIFMTTLIGGSVAAAGPAGAATVRYVALGDSYSSGLGAGNYDPASGSCRRSSNAYPARWAAAHSPASFSFTACSGARTTDVLSGQLGPLNSDTTLVSITIGGNDAGFSNVMETCVLGSDSACLAAVAGAQAFAQNELPGRLNTLFSAIDSRAPSAHVVVLDYPHLYMITNVCVGLSNTKRTALNNAADTLDTVISKATAEASFAFSDVRDDFAGHELCSGDGWLRSVTIPIGESYHPTALGHSSGYLPAFTGAAGAAARAAEGR